MNFAGGTLWAAERPETDGLGQESRRESVCVARVLGQEAGQVRCCFVESGFVKDGWGPWREPAW